MVPSNTPQTDQRKECHSDNVFSVDTSKGYFIVPRSIFESGIWAKPSGHFKVLMYLWGNANHSPYNFAGLEIQRGQCICFYERIAHQLFDNRRRGAKNLSRVKHIMRDLQKTGHISVSEEPQGTLITVLHYDALQNPDNYKRTEKQSAEKQAPNQSGTHNKKEKNEKKKNIPFDEKIWKDTVSFLTNKCGFDKAEGFIWSKIKKYGVKAVEKTCRAWGRSGFPVSEFDDWCLHYKKRIAEDELRSLPDL